MATYDDAFEIMLETARDYKWYSEKLKNDKKYHPCNPEIIAQSEQLAKNAMQRLFGQAEMCKELFGIYALQTLCRIERKLDE